VSLGDDSSPPVAFRVGDGLLDAPSADVGEVFRLHGRYVAGVATRLMGRTSDVDDVVQDVFLRAHRNIGQLREPGALRAWLVTLTVRVVRRRFRTDRLRAFFHLSIDEPIVVDSLVSPDLSESDRAVLQTVYATLEKLPTQHRLAWTLRHLEGYELERVAEVCECSLATVKRWIQAAHVRIEEALAHGG